MLCSCIQTPRACLTGATYSSLIPEISPELQTFSHRDWLHMAHSLTAWPLISFKTLFWINLRTQVRKMQNMFACLHLKSIAFGCLWLLVALALHVGVHVMMYGAPECGGLFHVSQLAEPAGKMTNGEVHEEVAFWAAECRWDFSPLIFLQPEKGGGKDPGLPVSYDQCWW